MKKNVLLPCLACALAILPLSASGMQTRERGIRKSDPVENLEKNLERARLIQEKEDDAPQKIIALFIRQAREESDPWASAIYHSLSAQSLWEYGQSRTFARRTARFPLSEKTLSGLENPPAGKKEKTSREGSSSEPIESWDTETLLENILFHLENACPENLSDYDRQQDEKYEHAILLTDSNRTSYRPLLPLVLSYRNWDILDRMQNRFPEYGLDKQIEKNIRRIRSLIGQNSGSDSLDAGIDFEIRYLRYRYARNAVGREQYRTSLLSLLDGTGNTRTRLKGDILYLLAELEKDENPYKAEEWALKARKYPLSWGSGQGEILLKEILSPALELDLAQVQVPGRAMAVNIREKNCRAFSYRFLKIGRKEMETYLSSTDKGKTLEEIFKSRTDTIRPEIQVLPLASEDLRFHQGKIFLPSREKGCYILQTCILSPRYAGKETLAQAPYEPEYQLIQVSDIAYFCYPPEKNRSLWEGFCLDRRSGTGLPGVKVDFFHIGYRYEKRRNVPDFLSGRLSGSDGRFQVDSGIMEENGRSYSLLLRFSLGPDTLWGPDRILLNRNQPSDPDRKNRQRRESPDPWKKIRSVHYFSNLPVYRKGDSVKIRLLLVPAEEDTAFFGTDRNKTYPEKIQVMLKDPENRLQDRFFLPVCSNGTARLEFALPSDAQAGFWSLSTSGCPSRLDFEVENYKRPSFEAVWEEIPRHAAENGYRLQGKAAYLSGEKLQEAHVSYRIYRKSYLPFYRFSSYRNVGEYAIPIGQYETATDTGGRFEIRFRPDTFPTDPSRSYGYAIECDITDKGGETQSIEAYIPLRTAYELVGEYPGFLIGKDGKWINGSGRLHFSLSGLNPGQKWQDTRAQIRIFRLQDSLENSAFAPGLDQIPFAGKPDNLLETETVGYMDGRLFKEMLPEEPYFDAESRNRHAVREEVPVSEDQARLLADSACFDLPPGWKPGIYEIRIRAVTPEGNPVEKSFRTGIAKIGQACGTGMNASAFRLCQENIRIEKGKAELTLAVGNPFRKPLPCRFRIEDADGRSLTFERTAEPGFHTQGFSCKGLDIKSDWAVSMFCQIANHTVVRNLEIRLPQEKRTLEISLEGIPGRAVSGEKGKLRFHLDGKQPCGRPQALIIGLYDQSLDFFAPQGSSWPANLHSNRPDAPSLLLPPFRKAYGTAWNQALFSDNRSYAYHYPIQRTAAYRSGYPDFPARLDWEGISILQFGARMYKSALLAENASANGAASRADDRTAAGPDAAAGIETGNPVAAEQTGGENPAASPSSLRKDFHPEVFFLLCPWQENDSGYAAGYDFSYPSYFGRFKLRCFAYTDRLYAGYCEYSLQVSKDLMLYPQSPRFVREGDSVVLSCRYLIGKDYPDASGNSRLEWKIRLDAVLEDGRSITVEETDTQTAISRTQGNFEIPLRVGPGWKELQATYEARLVRPSGETAAEDRLQEKIPVEEGKTCVHEYQSFFIRQNSEEDIRTRFSLPCDSLQLRSNASAEPLVREILAGKTYDSCRTAFMAAEKMLGYYYAGKDWKSVWPALLAFYKKDGGFGWLKESPVSYPVSLQVLETLSLIPQEEFAGLPDGYAVLLRTFRFLAWHIREDYLQDTASTCKAENGKPVPASDKIRFLSLCRQWPQWARSCGIQAEQAYYRDMALRSFGHLSLENQARLSEYLLEENRPEEAAAVLSNLNRLALYDSRQGMYWKREALGYCPGKRIQSMSRLARAYARAAAAASQQGKSRKSDTLREQCREILNGISTRQQSLDFSHSQGSGIGVRELGEWASALLSASLPVPESGNIPAATETNPVLKIGHTLRELPQDRHVETFGKEEIRSFRNRIRLEWKTGKKKRETGTEKGIFFSSSRCAFGSLRASSTQEIARIRPQEGDGNLVIRRSYRKIGQGNLKQGDIVEVVLEIRARRDFNYVHFSSPRPAGLEWAQTQSGFAYESGFGFYKDIDDTAFEGFAEFLPRGTYFVTYRLKAQNKGVFSNGPASIESQNESAFGSHSGGGTLRVE